MDKRGYALAVCTGLLLSACAGCRLARPDAAQTPEPDRLIGVYATEEYLDLFDYDAYFDDNAGKLAQTGETVISPQDGNAYGGRIWAVQEDNGDWVFADLEGMGFYAYRYENGAEAGVASHLDEGLTAGGMHVTSADEGESVELEATIYHVPGGRVRYHFNPVYQTPDGAVYLTAGTGIYLEGTGEGEASTQTISDAVTTAGPGGKSTATGCSAAVTVEIMYAPSEIVILQMDEDGGVLARDSYDPGQVPESLTPAAECAYLVAETHKTGPAGDIVTRQLADAGTECLSTFRAREDGVCVKQDTALLWTGEAEI